MKKKLTRALIVMVSAMMIVSLAGCGSQPKERTVRMHIHYTYSSGVSCIMKEKEFLEKHLPEGVTVEWIQLTSGVDARDALISGQIDIGGLALINYISAYENGLPLTLLSYHGSMPVNIFSNDPEITAMDKFTETSRIAIANKSTIMHMAFLAYCKDTLGDAMIYDNQLTTIPAADALASLQTSKDFNAGVFSYPMLLKAKEVEHLVLLADLTETIEKYGIGSALVMRSDYYEENKDIVEAFLEAQDETVQFMWDNPEETAQILSGLFDVEADDILDVLQAMPPHKEMVGYDMQAQLMYEAGILEKEPTKFADLPNYENIPK